MRISARLLILILTVLWSSAWASDLWQPEHLGWCKIEEDSNGARLLVEEDKEKLPNYDYRSFPLGVINLGGCDDVSQYAEPLLHQISDWDRWSGFLKEIRFYCRGEPSGTKFLAVERITHHQGNRHGSWEHDFAVFRMTGRGLKAAKRLSVTPKTGTLDGGEWFVDFLVEDGRVEALVTVESWLGSNNHTLKVFPISSSEVITLKTKIFRIARIERDKSVRHLILANSHEGLSAYEVTANLKTKLLHKPSDFGASDDSVARAPTLVTAQLELLQWYRDQTSNAWAPYPDPLRDLELDLIHQHQEFESPCWELTPKRSAELWRRYIERLEAPLFCTDWDLVSYRPWERIRITSSGSRFLGLGPADSVFTSIGGDDWDLYEQPGGGMLADLASDGQIILAVGGDGAIWSTTDGARWDSRNSGVDTFLYGVTWTGNEWVAVGASGTILRSSDGQHWQTHLFSEKIVLSDVVAHGERFVAVGRSGQRGVAVSWNPDDGWWQTILPVPLERVSAWMDEFIALESTKTLVSSINGKTWNWTETKDPVCFSYASTQDGRTCIDFEGNAWQSHPGLDSLYRVTSWHKENEPTWSEVAVGDGSTIKVGHYYWGLTAAQRIGEKNPSSIDLFKWGRVNGLVWNGASFLGTHSSNHVLTSSDGQRWRWHSKYPAMVRKQRRPLRTLWHDERLLGFNDAGQAGESYDGINWIWRDIKGVTKRLSVSALAASPKVVVAASRGGKILVSNNGKDWREAELPPEPRYTRSFHDVVWTGKWFLVVGDYFGVMQSSDGRFWEIVADRYPDHPFDRSFSSIAVQGERWIAASSRGLFSRSSDGTWCEAYQFSSQSNQQWQVRSLESGGFVAVSDSGSILTSEDGLNWVMVLDQFPFSSILHMSPQAGDWRRRMSLQTVVEREYGTEMLATSQFGIFRTTCQWQ